MRASVFEKDERRRLSRDGLAAWIRSIGIAAGVGVAYFLAAELSNGFLITPETVIFWPAAGISSGALIALWSIARWPVLAGVMIATAAANLLRDFSVTVTAVWVLGNTAEPLIIALEPIREVWIHDEAFVASRLSIIRIMARRTKAVTVAA
jgi:hypothetical protein